MNIHLTKVRVENLRSIKNATVALNPFSVMFGMNDSGKSNFLLALSLALGNRMITEKDVFCSENLPYSKETEVIIDLMFIPIDEQNKQIETFDDSWGLHLGDNVQTDNSDKEYFAFRTKFIYDNEKGEYKKERLLITSWTNEGVVEDKAIGNKTLSAFEFVYLDAHRDISLDIRDKSSMWSRQLSKLKMTDSAKAEIEGSLASLGAKIMEESPFLQQVSEDLTVSTNKDDSEIEIHPITRTVDEIYKGLDIYVTQNKSAAISISNMGSGTRSRAVFASLKSIINEKIRNATDSPYFFIVAFEEPEAHIHPQAQRKLISDFANIEGQRILTTHSPYILSSSEISDLVYVSLQNAETVFSELSKLALEDDELAKIKRMVIDTYGEILFANLVVFAEGYTERIALPVFFKKYFGCEPYELGVSITGVDGQGNYSPFIRAFESINIPWFILSDGENEILTSLKAQIKKVKGTETDIDLNEYENIVVLDNPYNYEGYLIYAGYIDEIITAINECEPKAHANAPTRFQSYVKYKFGQPNAPKCTVCGSSVWVKSCRDICCSEGKKQALLDCLIDKKIRYAVPIAKKIVSSCVGERCYPPKILKLLKRIGQYMEVQNEIIDQTEPSC